jgi:hypothetical protein
MIFSMSFCFSQRTALLATVISTSRNTGEEFLDVHPQTIDRNVFAVKERDPGGFL